MGYTRVKKNSIWMKSIRELLKGTEGTSRQFALAGEILR